MHAPAVPVVANVAAAPLTDPRARSPQGWSSRSPAGCAGARRSNGSAPTASTTLYEIGAGKVLSGLARRIDRDLATANVGTPAEVEAALAALSLRPHCQTGKDSKTCSI